MRPSIYLSIYLSMCIYIYIESLCAKGLIFIPKRLYGATKSVLLKYFTPNSILMFGGATV